MATKLLLLSNSRSASGGYLHWAREAMHDFLGKRDAPLLFIPYAEVPGTRASYDGYASTVKAAFGDIGYDVRSIHEAEDPQAAVRAADAIIVGGGNSFQLLAQAYRQGILDALRERIHAGAPYVGWSAGSNLACPGIWTTNDMPIVQPPSLRALDLVPFQINPHFTEAHPRGHQGDTRAERIAEFLALRPEVPVIGLRECALLRVEAGITRLYGTGGRIFRAGRAPADVGDGAEVSFRA